MTTTTVHPLAALQQALDYRFRDLALLERALVHKSFSANNNERLEFLGDSVLNMIAALYLFQNFPGSSEGDMSRLRAAMVRADALADIAARIELRRYLRVSAGHSSNAVVKSTLADAMEAIFAAVFLDGGFEAARQVIQSQLLYLLKNGMVPLQKDSKTQLQEILQQSGLALPAYRTLSHTDLRGDAEFRVECRVAQLNVAVMGTARNRKEAEQKAAAAALPLCRNRR